MTETLAGLPVPVVALALWSFALVRGAGYYLLGRLSHGRPGGRVDAWAQRVSHGLLRQAEVRFERWGPKSIIFAYPVYGVSAGTQIVAGAIRMSLVSFYLALGVVSLPWATMQALIGITAFQAIVAGYTPWVLAGAAVLFAGWWLMRRHQRLRAGSETGGERT